MNQILSSILLLSGIEMIIIESVTNTYGLNKNYKTNDIRLKMKNDVSMHTNYTIHVTILMFILLLFTPYICSFEPGQTPTGAEQQLLMQAQTYKQKGAIVSLVGLSIALGCIGLNATCKQDSIPLLVIIMIASGATIYGLSTAMRGYVEEAKQLEKQRAQPETCIISHAIIEGK